MEIRFFKLRAGFKFFFDPIHDGLHFSAFFSETREKLDEDEFMPQRQNALSCDSSWLRPESRERLHHNCIALAARIIPPRKYYQR
jgi:hypothetical protein